MLEFSQEWLCRRLVEGSRDAVICADRAGIIRLWNAGAAEMFSYAPAKSPGPAPGPDHPREAAGPAP
jgi:PAS domain-containing protein